MHVDDISEISKCNIESCTLRHPQCAVFFKDYTFSKFRGDCSFSHKVNTISNDMQEKEIENFKTELVLLKDDTRMEILEKKGKWQKMRRRTLNLN